ncbi:MAG TPA: YceI family protein [Albitalea sp.]|nr:YceI family protein [Albitalea sp.]
MRLAALAAWLAPLLAAPAWGQPVTYVVDAAHTKVYWEVRHFGTSTQRGRFDRARGSIVIDRQAGRGEVSISIDTASVSSGVPALDAILRGASFLATEEHPTAYFVTRQLHFAGDRPEELRGEFTLRGVSRPLSLHPSRFGCRQDALLQRQVCGGDFEAQILRSDFGSTFGLPFVGDQVHLLIAVEGIRTSP